MDLKGLTDRNPAVNRGDLRCLLEMKHSLMGQYLEATRSAAGLCDKGLVNLDTAELMCLLERRDECIGGIEGIDRQVIGLGPNPGNLSGPEWERILELLDAIQKRALQAAALSETVQSFLALACRRFQGQPSSTGAFQPGRARYTGAAVESTPRFLDTRS